MSEQEAGAEPVDEQDRPRPDGRQESGDADRGRDAEGEERQRLSTPRSSPLGGAGAAGGSRTAREARTNFHIAGDNRIYENNAFIQSQFLLGTDEVLVAGPVPREELEHLDRVYHQVPGYRDMKERLRRTRLLALCGEHGTGRTSTALALLTELTGGRVSRLDPATALGTVDGEKLEKDHGYLLELPAEDLSGLPAGHEHHDGREARAPGYPTELHLDRLSALFAERDSYGVLLVDGGDLAEHLPRGRYGVVCAPPPAAEVLDRHLRILLADAPAETLRLARANADRADVKEALGLDELRPGEAARLAAHLARHSLGELSDDELLEECRWFAPRQARDWFTGADRPGRLPEAMPALRAAALRIALAVFNGSAYSIVAEAGELLAWEMALTLDPRHSPGRPLFGTRTADRPAVARAVHDEGVEDLGDATIPVRVVRFEGRRLTSAVLREAWNGHHNVRGPMVRWLRALCDDPRPQVWVRAAIAAGVLCSWDYLYGFTELLLPLGRADSAVQRMAAATALAEASRDPAVRPAVKGLLREWARGDDGHPLETAALAHGYGLPAGSVSASLDELGRIGCREDGGMADIASYSVARLLAGTEPGTVLRRLARWLNDRRQARQNLALLAVLRAVSTRTSHLWGLQDTPALEPYGSWPLVGALAAARPELGEWLADLVWYALDTARSGAAAQEAVAVWLRGAARDERQLDVARGFLPRLVCEPRDRDRLLLLVARLARDGDEPLDGRAAALLREALEEAEAR
ncbi:hypothetical protein [Streptomyces macrosporus]|uniref:AAA+ ATPase domain-containing protein n=1 Tax=Streptomyces macrosporus TaxID=44032 RepID=A0ABN3K5E6_9ACTN